jgi:multiple sugar transport system substrate-binding protein
MTTNPTLRRRFTGLLAAAACATTLAACGGGGGATAKAGDTGGDITLWTHNAGNGPELAADQKVVDDFNASQSNYKVKVQAFPQTSYNPAVIAAASAKKLPCLLDVDSPNVPSWVWGGYLAPLDLTGSEISINDQLPSTVGQYNGKVYSFGLYDVALTFIARKSVLARYGVRIPTMSSPWTLDEFNAGLAKLKSSGKYQYPLDMQTFNVNTEWAPYAYSPLLQSFGGDLVDRSNYTTAKNVLNGDKAVQWASWFRSLVKNGYMAQKSGTSPNDDFLNGKTALLYDGSWDAVKDQAKLGSDVAFLPPPNLGNGPKVGGGSWQWAMSKGCDKQNGAQAFLKFMRQSKYFTSVSAATGTIPAAYASANADANYKPGGPLNFAQQFAKDYAVVRPVTPAYPFIATTFQKTAADLLSGADPKGALDQAVTQVDNNISSNGDYKD